MLTIRHVEHTGHETILQTRRVTSHPGNQIVGGKRVVFWEKDDGSTVSIALGKVYVMNDGGKTVAVYDLDMGPGAVAGAKPGRCLGRFDEFPG